MHVQVCKKRCSTTHRLLDVRQGSRGKGERESQTCSRRNPSSLYTHVACKAGSALKLGHADLAIGMRSFRRFLVPSLLFSDSSCIVRFRRPSPRSPHCLSHFTSIPPSLRSYVLHCSHSFYLIQFSTPPRRKATGESSLRPGGSGSLLLNCANKRNRDSRSRGAPCNQGGSF